MAANLVIASVLTNDAAVAALVNDRVNPSIAEPDANGAAETLPYIVFEMEASDPWQAADGHTGTTTLIYSIRCFAATRSGSTVLREAVRLALDHLPETTVSTQTVLLMRYVGSDETFEYRNQGGQEPVYESSLDFDTYVREVVS